MKKRIKIFTFDDEQIVLSLSEVKNIYREKAFWAIDMKDGSTYHKIRLFVFID